jgi:uncharacterized protein
MINKKKFLEITNQYDLENTGINRDFYIQKLLPSLERKEILILKGVRRCGKTTILKQLIQHLIKKKDIKKKNILYVNFDDFNFLPHLNLDLLEVMMSTRDMDEKQYIFLDEIQKIPSFESWLKTYYDRGINIKFIISGSNATLLAKDMGTLLTGRNLTFEIFPLSYKEFLSFKPEGNLNEYMEYGGYPEVVLEKNTDEKLNILRNYVNDIINKDVLQRHQIRDQKKVLLFAQHILSNPGIKISINKLAKLTNTSKDTVSKYLEYMIDAYIIIEIPYFSYSTKAKFHQTQSPKYYALDNGFYRVNTTRNQKGNQCENLIAIFLRRKTDNIFYWSEGESEVDFIVDGSAYNVTTTKEIPPREIKGLKDLKKKQKAMKKYILLNPEKEETTDDISYKQIKNFLTN